VKFEKSIKEEWQVLMQLIRSRKKEYDVTIFQTPIFKQKKGFEQVYRLQVEGLSHDECLYEVFSRFNIADRMPADFAGRFIGTGDILFIDEGRKGQFYYQLKPGGWQKINRIQVC
jgi:YodL-like